MSKASSFAGLVTKGADPLDFLATTLQPVDGTETATELAMQYGVTKHRVDLIRKIKEVYKSAKQRVIEEQKQASH